MSPIPQPIIAVGYRPVDTLTLDPRNARKHTEHQISQIAASIRSFGFNVPILIDASGKVLAGHGRFLASRKLSLTEVPTVRLDHLTPAQARAFAIADNRLAENATWDDALLGGILLELSQQHLDFSLEATGFTFDEIEIRIEGVQGGAEAEDPADHLPVPVKGAPVSQFGDLWLLGPHRVLCGDATRTADMAALMGDTRAALCFTDPPYGVAYGASSKDRTPGPHRPILNDDLGEDFAGFLTSACTNILAATDGAVYICMSSSALHLLQHAFLAAGGHWSTFLIWAKQAFTLGRSDYQRQYEPILYGWRQGADRHWCGVRNQGDVWFFDKPTRNDLHPTMKPVALVMRALRNSSCRGDIVLDPFLGSGTTLIAAERSGRVCHGMELDPSHVDTIVRRWQEHTGAAARHAVSGAPFEAQTAMTGEVRHD